MNKIFFPQLMFSIVIIIIAILWLIPTLGLFISSFRTPQAVMSSGWWKIFRNITDFRQLTIDNYINTITNYGLARALLNSLIITIPSTVLPIFIASLAAFAFVLMEFSCKRILYMIVIGLLVVPIQTTMVPILRIYNNLGLSGTFPGLWLVHTGYGLPLAIYMLYNFFMMIPKELFEAAYVEGANSFTIYQRILIPLSMPAIASLTVFQFLWVWNDLLIGLIYLGGNEQVAPLTVKVSNMVNSLGQNWHLLTSAAFISMIMPLTIFFLFQRYFEKGILVGAVKG